MATMSDIGGLLPSLLDCPVRIGLEQEAWAMFATASDLALCRIKASILVRLEVLIRKGSDACFPRVAPRVQPPVAARHKVRRTPPGVSPHA
jgi:hypothetical protein